MRPPRAILDGYVVGYAPKEKHPALSFLKGTVVLMLIIYPRLFRLVRSPHKFVMALRGLSRSDIHVFEFRDGLRLRTRNSGSDLRALLETSVWNLYTEGLHFSPAQDLVVIDIGAHIGTFSVSTAWRFKQSRVYSFEPFKENFDMFLSNIELNRVNNVFPSMAAVAGQRGMVSLGISDSNTGGHSICFAGQSSTLVEALTLSDVFSSNGLERCDLLKIDCEGAEYDILFNTPSSVLRKIKNIAMEYHNVQGHSGEEMAKFLRANGFEVLFTGVQVTEPWAIGLLRATLKEQHGS